MENSTKKEDVIPASEWSENGTYYRVKRVQFSECKTNTEMSLDCLNNTLAEAASAVPEIVGQTIEGLMERNLAFMLTRHSLRIFKRPVADDRIVCSAWAKETGKKILSRDVEARSMSGELMCAFHLTYMVVDLTKMKSIEYTGEESPNRITLEKDSDAPDCSKIMPHGIPVKLGEQVIYRSDLDYNNHVNNKVYIRLATDFMPKKYYDMPLNAYIVNYTGQTSLGDTIELYGEKTGSGYAIFGMVEGTQQFACEFIYLLN